MRTKILLSLVIIFCISITSNAQINKDGYLLGGAVNFNSGKNQEPPGPKTRYLNSSIQFGKAVKSNTFVGIILSYLYSYNAYSTNPYYNKINQYGAGVFYRKYKSIFKNFYFLGETDALYIHSENIQGQFQTGSDGAKAISDGAYVSFIPGLSYQLCKRAQIELLLPNIFSVSYSKMKTDYTSSTTPSTTVKGNAFSVSANLNANLLSNFGIGFKFIL